MWHIRFSRDYFLFPERACIVKLLDNPIKVYVHGDLVGLEENIKNATLPFCGLVPGRLSGQGGRAP